MKHLIAKDIMTRDFMTVPKHWTLDELSQFLIDREISGAPVVDEAGKLIGVVSLTDIVRHDSFSELELRADEPHDYYLHGWENRLTADDLSSFHVEEKSQVAVQEIMTPFLFKISENTPIREIANIMIDGLIHRLLVTHNDKIVGIVTTMDLLKVIRDM